ncbi:MAG TPA: hypothetical protein VH637_23130 [Streptosporangiaceae bacterium]|jgi:hypothetical protein
MNREFDELVRDSMAWFTDAVDVPAGLAAEVRRSHRRRRRVRACWLTGTTVAGVTAVASAAAVAFSTGPAAQPPAHRAGTGQATVQTTAVVISKVDQALAKAGAGDPVAYTRETGWGFRIFLAIPHGKPAAVQASVIRRWSRGSLEHVQFSTRSGKLALSMVSDTRSGRSVDTTVSYPQQVWWRRSYQPAAPAAAKVGCTVDQVDRTPAQWAREVRKLLSCGAAVAGHQRVDGADTIELTLRSSYQRACAASSYGRCQPQDVGWHGTLWADASTYLPVRLKSHGHGYGFRIDFRWLQPTAANLAMLRQPIPSGFRHG